MALRILLVQDALLERQTGGGKVMPIIARDDRKPYTPAPPGLHNAVCVDVVDLGLIDSQWGEKPQIELRWQIERENPETGKPFLVVRRFTLSLSEKSNLRPFLEGWL